MTCPLVHLRNLMVLYLQLCENLESIERVANMDHSVMAEDFLKRDNPVNVTDGMTDWEASDKFNVQFLHQVIL